MITNVTSKVDLPAAANRRSQPDPLPVKVKGVEPRNGYVSTLAAPTHRVELEQAVGKVREALQQSGSQLQIEIDPDLQRVVVKILNGDSGEVIRQIPPQEVIDLAKNLTGVKGLLYGEHV